MLKKLSSLALVISCSLFASEDVYNEYKGKVAGIITTKSNQILIGIVKKEDENINCLMNTAVDVPTPFSFERDQPHSKEWFDIFNLVRRTQETIRIGYIESSNICSIEYLNLMQGDGSTTNIDNVGTSLTRKGEYGNIALIYTNNLTESSYTASDHRGEDTPAGAFDGYIWQKQIEEDTGSLINRGIWLVKKDKEDKEIKYWLQVEFEQAINVSGFRVMINEKAADLGRGPRSITILASTDGENFVEQGAFSLSKSVDQRANLPDKVELKYFRIQVNSNFGDAFIEIDELEIYSD
ncbi:MAG: hypothetical protein ACI9LM_001934 [Alteromonadaceae bacterium]|jgi:hypothetical protein